MPKQTFLRDPHLAHVAVLMETPIKTDEHNKEDWTHDMSQILKAKALMGRRPTPQLPHEFFPSETNTP